MMKGTFKYLSCAFREVRSAWEYTVLRGLMEKRSAKFQSRSTGAQYSVCSDRYINITKMGSSQVYLIGAVFLYALVQSGHALSCWTCSSDLDITCGDHFNTTQILQQRSYYRNVDYQNQQYQGGNQYGNQPAYGSQQYGNNNNQYGGNNQYGSNQYGNSGNNRMPALSPCQNNLGGMYGQKQVCMKKVFNMPDGRRIVSRDCKAVSDRTFAGRCPTEITGRGTSVEFCEYCEYDGCNSATGLRNNILFAVLPCAVLYFFRK